MATVGTAPAQGSSEPSSDLLAKIAAREPGICLYGFAPPKSASSPEQLSMVAAQQVQRLSPLGLDGLIVYDIQDEAERTAEPRPFPFLPTVPPEVYVGRYLAELALPKIVYRCVNRDSTETFTAWLTAESRPALSVLVGAPSRNAVRGLGLREAYALARRHAPDLVLGGVAIAERHERNLDEHERMLSKGEQGCRFFVTQGVYDVTSTLSLLSDYALRLEALEAQPAPVILTFSPCGSVKGVEFMKWLGIRFPRWLENELRFARDPLATSVALCQRIFAEVWAFARSKGIPVGVNVESVSIRKAEIEASLELLTALRAIMR